MFTKKMKSSAIISGFLELYTQYGAMLARTVIAIFFYILVKDGFVYISEHLKNYIIFVILSPFAHIPALGHVVDYFLDSVKENDALAHAEWNRHFPSYVSIEQFK